MTMLREKTEELLDDPRAADKLRLVDDYILQQRRVGERFVLPQEHRDLRPVLEAYAEDFPKFVAYVRRMRDAMPMRSETYIEMHELYRTLEVRLVQQERRARAARALEWFDRNYPEATMDQRIRWVRKLEQQWGRRRMGAMMAVRRTTAYGRLSSAEREIVLRRFWERIDDEIRRGELDGL